MKSVQLISKQPSKNKVSNMFLEHPQKPSDAVDKLVIQVIVDICDSIVEEHNLNVNFNIVYMSDNIQLQEVILNNMGNINI